MKTITTYECEICREQNSLREGVEACEARGRPDVALYPPVGTIIGNGCGPAVPCKAGNHGACYAGFVFVVTSMEPHQYDLHQALARVAIFRGNGLGDEEIKPGHGRTDCGHLIGQSRWGDSYGTPAKWPEAQDCPALRRAMEACAAAGIPSYALRGGKAVRAAEALGDQPGAAP